jgi:NADPH-dependent 2,4-dienoyl-CoA reductase/sulfur reductase-like enzyme
MGLIEDLGQSINNLVQKVFVAVYVLVQRLLALVFATGPPPPPEQNAPLRRPRIAIIGSGLTGVSSAAHCVGHGFDVKIFEARSKEQGLGGIWSVGILRPPLSDLI